MVCAMLVSWYGSAVTLYTSAHSYSGHTRTVKQQYDSLTSLDCVTAYLVILELAVLQVGRGGDCAHTRVGVVVRILTHAVGETLLWDEDHRCEGLLSIFPKCGGKSLGLTDTPGPSMGHAGSETLLPSPSYSTRKSVLQLLFVFPSWWKIRIQIHFVVKD